MASLSIDSYYFNPLTQLSTDHRINNSVVFSPIPLAGGISKNRSRTFSPDQLQKTIQLFGNWFAITLLQSVSHKEAVLNPAELRQCAEIKEQLEKDPLFKSHATHFHVTNHNLLGLAGLEGAAKASLMRRILIAVNDAVRG